MNNEQLRACLERVRGGDKEAFGRVYDALKQPVFTVAWRILRSQEAAEDVTHDVFVKLFAAPPAPAVNNPRAWIFQMARNRAIDVLRRAQTADGEDAALAAEDALGERLLRLDVEAAIAALSRREREVLTLRLNADLPFHEIAHITGASLSSVYRTYRKALKTVQTTVNGGAV